MFMELSFGQYAALGPVAIYRRFCPLFRGLGYGMIIVSAIVMLYYNLIIGWTIFYMFASMKSELPWQHCEPEWSTERKINKRMTKVKLFPELFFARLLFVRGGRSMWSGQWNILLESLLQSHNCRPIQLFRFGITFIKETTGRRILWVSFFCGWILFISSLARSFFYSFTFMLIIWPQQLYKLLFHLNHSSIFNHLFIQKCKWESETLKVFALLF